MKTPLAAYAFRKECVVLPCHGLYRVKNGAFSQQSEQVMFNYGKIGEDVIFNTGNVSRMSFFMRGICWQGVLNMTQR